MDWNTRSLRYTRIYAVIEECDVDRNVSISSPPWSLCDGPRDRARHLEIVLVLERERVLRALLRPSRWTQCNVKGSDFGINLVQMSAVRCGAVCCDWC